MGARLGAPTIRYRRGGHTCDPDHGLSSVRKAAERDDIGTQRLWDEFRPLNVRGYPKAGVSMSDVLVVVGVGGLGQSIARRQGAGKSVVLADINESTLGTAAAALEAEGYCVSTHVVDVASRESVVHLTEVAGERGDNISQVVHSAGLSPVQASADAVFAVDLVGTAVVLEEFGRVIAAGGAGVVIASMAGHLLPLLADQERALASTPADELLSLPFVNGTTDPGLAYGIAKRANQIRVAAASIPWAQRGARINSISPGVISTPMGRQELASESGALIRGMVESSAAKRLGTPEDIAAVAAFLLGPNSALITGSDLLVDGGVVAATRTGSLALPAGEPSS